MLSETSNVFLVRILLREPADGYGAIGAADWVVDPSEEAAVRVAVSCSSTNLSSIIPPRHSFPKISKVSPPDQSKSKID